MSTLGRFLQCVGGWSFVTGLLIVPALLANESREARNLASEARLKKDVTTLASPLFEGRGATTQGLYQAGEYLAREFKKIGLKPAVAGSYFQPFAIQGAVGSLTLVGPRGQTIELKQGVHFQPLGFDQGGTATGPIVFAGYGLNCSDPPYDDYQGIEVRGKIVVLLRDTPRASNSSRTKEMANGASFVAKLTLAQKKGAAAVLLVNDSETAQQGDFPVDYSFTSLTRGGKHLLGLSIRRSVLESMLPADKTLSGIEQDIDRELKPQSFELAGWTARVEVTRKADAIPLRNVVGVLEGSGPLAQQTVVVGAHYDHLGYGGPSSLAPGKKRAIHHGADDNASGTSAMLEVARRFAGIPNRQGRRLVFIAFSGEELGLFGSRHYCNHPLFPLADTAAMFNLDMVGRLQLDEKTNLFRLLTEGHGTAKEFKDLIESQAKKHGFTLRSKESGFGPSDHASFCGKKIPVLFFWTGTHADYHRPSDTADRINVEGMRRIVDMSEEVVAALTQMDKPAFVEVKGAPTGRPSKGPRLGIRPGYGGDEEGVEVEGVTSGSAAEKAGIQDGDRIIAIAGKPIKDLNGYMQAMALQKTDTTIEVVVVRKDKKLTLKVKLD